MATSASATRRRAGSRGPVRTLRIAPVQGTGDAILAIASDHLGESYVLGARAPMANADWKGPWDCAEFASWCVFQSSGRLFGVRPKDDPVRADAYTGFWAEDAIGAAACRVEEAVRIPGAMLLRKPATRGRGGHIAISDGGGGTVEAHSSNEGVIRSTANGRRWDAGVLVPGIAFAMSDAESIVTAPTNVIRLTQPLTRGPKVLAIQKRLTELGYRPGALDGVYGPQTVSAVVAFQNDEGLVPDGEVGDRTRVELTRRDRP